MKKENPVDHLNRLRRERSAVMQKYRDRKLTAKEAVAERHRLDEAILREERTSRK